MKPWETWLHGTILVLTLALAWTSWKHEEPQRKESVTILDPGSGGIERIEWDDGQTVATVEIAGKGEDVSTWVTAGRRKKLPTPKTEATPAPAEATPAPEGASTEATPKAEPTPKPEPTPKAAEDDEEDGDTQYGEPELRSFPGNDQAGKLVEGFRPLVALREFTGLDGATLKEMGLEKPKGTLLIRAGGKDHRFEVGDKAYGSSDNYLRPAGGTTVYLVSSTVLGPLRGAENRLIERNPFAFEPTDAAKARISGADPAKVLQAVQQGRHDKTNAFWTTEGAAEAKDTVLDGWMDKLLQLRATTFPLVGEKPEAASVELLLSATFTDDAAVDLGTVEVGRRVDAARSKPDEAVYAFWIRSPRTRSEWVQVSKTTAQELVDGLPGLLDR